MNDYSKDPELASELENAGQLQWFSIEDFQTILNAIDVYNNAIVLREAGHGGLPFANIQLSDKNKLPVLRQKLENLTNSW